MKPKPIVCIFGPPGAGKTTLSKTIAENDEYYWISGGGLARRKLRDDPNSKLSQDIAAHCAHGLPLSLEMVRLLFVPEIQKAKSKSLILDGFPRSVEQLDFIPTLAAEGGFDQACILGILLIIDNRLAVERLKGRSECWNCGASNSGASRQCSHCESDMLDQRDDDQSDEAITSRIHSYYKSVTPTLEIFRFKNNLIEASGIDNPRKLADKLIPLIKRKSVGES